MNRRLVWGGAGVAVAVIGLAAFIFGGFEEPVGNTKIADSIPSKPSAMSQKETVAVRSDPTKEQNWEPSDKATADCEVLFQELSDRLKGGADGADRLLKALGQSEKKNPVLAAKMMRLALGGFSKSSAGDASSDQEAWNKDELQWAFAQIKGVPPSPSSNMLERRLGNKMIEVDPKMALAQASSITVQADYKQYINDVVHHWAEIDPDAAIAWTQTLSRGQLRDEAQISMATTWAQTEPEAAASYVANAFEAGPSQDKAARAVAERWAATEPGHAALWISRFPDGELRAQLLQTLVADWKSSDLMAFRNWENNLTDKDLRDYVHEIDKP